MQQEMYYVTSNAGKFTEVSRYISQHAPSLTLVQKDEDIPEIQTLDQRWIAIDKAKKAWEILKRPLLIDDAAIYFENYYKFPGTLSKFVNIGLGIDGIKRLIDEGDRAHFLLYMVYIEAPDKYKVFEGKCLGALTKKESLLVHPNLPYDLFFIPDGQTQTYAALSADFDTNASLFYRIQALRSFLTWYEDPGKTYDDIHDDQ